MSSALLVASDLTRIFPGRERLFGQTELPVHAIDHINLEIYPGETLGLVGESGCGKTTLGKCLIQLLPPTGGDVFYNIPENELREATSLVRRGEDGERLEAIRRRYALNRRPPEEMRRLRKELQIVLQDPFSSLNPRMLVRDILIEPFRSHGIPQAEWTERAVKLLSRVGLLEDHLWRYPHEFSGGQRQRICIARALALNPQFIVLDEPTSALDVSVQAQILNLLRGLRRDHRTAFLFISHDLRVVRYMANRIAVMYLGKIVEVGTKEQLEKSPNRHPYTEALLGAVPEPDPRLREKPALLSGELPSARNPPSGCRFRTRCPLVQSVCAEQEPPLVEREPGHLVACHFR
jgi:peptide/nickel transport system ATP-binding protein